MEGNVKDAYVEASRATTFRTSRLDDPEECRLGWGLLSKVSDMYHARS